MQNNQAHGPGPLRGVGIMLAGFMTTLAIGGWFIAVPAVIVFR